MKSIDRLARIYETKLWYPLVLNLYAGNKGILRFRSQGQAGAGWQERSGPLSNTLTT